MYFNQAEFEVRCEWGEHGVVELAPISDAIVIVVLVRSLFSAVLRKIWNWLLPSM